MIPPPVDGHYCRMQLAQATYAPGRHDLAIHIRLGVFAGLVIMACMALDFAAQE